MKRLVRADNLMIAPLWQQMLAGAGIRCDIRNRYLGAAVGELPADQVAPELWIRDDADEPRACALLEEFRRPARLPVWRCPRCGELVEGQFFQCWNCETTRPST